MDLSPFVSTRDIPPYNPSSGVCVCGCPDCLSIHECTLHCPSSYCQCFHLDCPGWWCSQGCSSCPDCPMPFPCPCWPNYSGPGYSGN